MTSNLFSRLVPQARGARSFYEQLLADDGTGATEEDGTTLDEENLAHNLDGLDLEQAAALMTGDSRATLGSAPRGSPRGTTFEPQMAHGGGSMGGISRGVTPGWRLPEDDADNDVPASLLVEPNDMDSPSKPIVAPRESRRQKHGPSALSEASSRPHARDKWGSSEAQLPQEHSFDSPRVPLNPQQVIGSVVAGSSKEKALWNWVNTYNLDRFVQDIYDYYEGCGMWCIILDRALGLLETAFIAVLLTVLTQCIDYHNVRGSHALYDIYIPNCTTKISLLWNVGLWIVVFYLIWKGVQFLVDLRRLSRVRAFYIHLLEIPERDMQTVSWQDIVARIMVLRDANPKTASNITPQLRKYMGSQSKERLDAHDIANRLMRQDNYLIAMINKDVLDFRLPIPFLRQRQFFSKTLEWCLQFSILDFVFNDVGQVRQEFLKSNRRGVLSQKLRQRFIFAGILNLIFAPFVMPYILMVYIFTYYQEYQKNPSILGARRYTALAEWKIREFNELPQIFRERLNMSYPFATRYLTQFPKQITEQLAKTVAFVTGALAAVLAAMSVYDPELLNLEITKDGTVLFYLTILGAVWAMARNSVSEETAVFNPEYALRNVIDYTHHCPDHWIGRLHSAEVMREFSELYKLKWVVVLEELLGILTAPCVLLFSLSRNCDQIVDFFREFTIHVDGLGYVCSFAVFDFKKPAGKDGLQHQQQQPQNLNQYQQQVNDVREDYYSTKHGKMAASFYGFLDNYVINPKTGIPGHMPPGLRHQFHPPPSFPGLNSPTLAAEVYDSRQGRDGAGIDRDKKAKGRLTGYGGHQGQGGRMFGGSGMRASSARPGAHQQPAPSPMASMLLDPHHQPNLGGRSLHRASRQARSVYHGQGEESVIRESPEMGGGGDVGDVADSGGPLGESVWETSPTHGLSRENSGAMHTADESETGVLGLIMQLQQTQRQSRKARVL